MCISWLLFLIIFMMINLINQVNKKKLLWGGFSYETATIILLCFPVITFFQSVLTRWVESENFFEELQFKDLTMFIIVCACISGIIGIELRKFSLVRPAYLAIWIMIVACFAYCIQAIVSRFDFKKGEFSSRFVSIQFQYAVIVEFVSIYAFLIMSTVIVDLVREHLPSISTQTSTSKSIKPSSEVPIVNV
ncbi:uncharacterized protein LOC135834697 [Planococcus citri]|uniref:uncharacterized protein LOC135834697 n=1 Tax=Planococcus citri TaxID=170843 RepID=UPI0031F8B7E2